MTRLHGAVLVLGCAALAASASPASAGGRRVTECSLRKDGATSVTEMVTHVGSGPHRLTLGVTTTVLLGGDSSITMTASMGKRTAIQTTYAFSGSTIHVTTDLGLGFKGIRHVDFTTTDGHQVTGQIDGREITASGTGTTVDALTFADGSPAPKLKVKPAVRRALAKAAKAVRGVSCPGATPAPQAIFDSCDRCKLGCEFDPSKAGGLLCVANTFSTAVACGASVIITPVFCVVSFELNGLSCTQNVIACEQLCEKSDDCCKVHCPGAVGQCCNGDGEVCCGQDGPSGGSCCTNCCGNPPTIAGAVCCGRGLISGEERNCIDPNIGLCCEPDGTICGGNDCCPPGWSCCNGGYCAPPGSECCSDPNVPSSTQNYFCGTGQHCVDPKQNLCCAPDAGPECGVQCCTGTQVCAAGDQCCSPLDLCGSTCCPSHNCLHGTECCPDLARRCGDHCCSGFEQCCNGQCCSGICVNGSICCPSINRVCGNVCCPEGSACTDPSTSQCEVCPGGGEACPPGNNPACCPSATQCCTGACCGAGELCCGQPEQCQPGFDCIH